jgi:hypothetical protein
MDLSNDLQPGDEVHGRCGHWHVVATVPGRDADYPYVPPMLHFTCNGRLYFAGTIGKPSRYLARRPSRADAQPTRPQEAQAAP